ncbi:MAG TPA: hypothetical protein VNL69_08380 [Bacteroidota bacterium]|nr:hypothetical protein [Bacteroidota bacterium]
MRRSVGCVIAALVVVMHGVSSGQQQTLLHAIPRAVAPSPGTWADTNETGDTAGQPAYLNAWGLDVLVSNDGFGLGTFYRREFSEDLFGFVLLSVSEAKDEREVEQFDPYYYEYSFVPGKLQRFLVVPLMFGIQHRLFRESITDNFRPYINAGVGPSMIFAAPFVDIVRSPTGGLFATQIEFFKSLGRGRAHYTASAFIGVGANFGTEKANVLGVNFRYYFTYLFGDGLPSMYDTRTGQVAARKRDFGGFFITLNVGMAY